MSESPTERWRKLHSPLDPDPAINEDAFDLLGQLYNRPARPSSLWLSTDMIPLATAAAIYSKAFLETLGKRSGDAVADLPKRVGDLLRKYVVTSDAYHIGVEGQATAMIVVTEDLPDEARLALLDLDVTAEGVRGKTLRWDATAGAWVPDV